jgi:predicted ester cyclase
LEIALRTIRLIVIMSACVALGLAGGYKLALIRQNSRLNHNKTLARLSHERVWSERDNSAAAKEAREIFSEDFVAHTTAGDSTGGLEGYIKELADNRANFPDWSEKVQSIIAEGDLVAVRFLSTGTQGQDIAAVPHFMPSTPNRHRPVRTTEIEIFRVANGKLAEQWDLYDSWDLNYQLGLFDPDHWRESVCEAGQKR